MQDDGMPRRRITHGTSTRGRRQWRWLLLPSAPTVFAWRMAGLVAALMLVVIASPLLAPAPTFGEGQELREAPASRAAAPVRFQAATPMASPISSPCEANDNLLPNGGFEQGAEGWYQNGTVEPTATDAHDGGAALRLGTTDEGGYIDRRISPFTVGVSYTLSGWGKLSASDDSGRIGILFLDQNGDRARAGEPVPLTFSSTTFTQQELTFVVPPSVAEVYVFANKDAGAGSFVVDSLALTTTCAPPGSPTPSAATPVSMAATPEGVEPPLGSPVAPAVTPSPATPEIPVASPVVSEGIPLTYYVDSETNLSIGYPADWRPLTQDEVREQLERAGRATDAVAASARFVAISPDGRAAIIYSRLPLPGEETSLDDVVQAVQEADTASITGIGEITTAPATLGGVPAVLIQFSAADPVTGEPGGRSIRQIVAIHDDAIVALTSIVQSGSSPALEETVRQIEENWRWGPAP